MHITLLAAGSRGDVQPTIALGAALRQAGHSVRIGSYAQFASLAAEHGLAFTAIPGDIQAMLQSEEGQSMMATRNPYRLLRLLRTHIRETAEQAWAAIQAAAQGADAIVSFGPFFYSGVTLNELHGTPHINAMLQPLFPTGEFPAPLLSAPHGSERMNRISHRASEFLFWQVLRPNINNARRTSGLEPLPKRFSVSQTIRTGQPVFYAYSRLLVPRPSDWPASTEITGFLFLDAPEGYAPPPELAAFLAAGDAPVYIGFGSMNTRDPHATGELALRALELSGRRGVLMRGWGGLDAADLPATVQMIDGAPHSWLFPQMAAVVHHAGAGTTAAGLRAGVPSICVPFFADQPFWAARVAALGVGPTPIPRAELTAEQLARAIEQAGAPQVARRAAAVGHIIAAEDGVGRAIRYVEQMVERRQRHLRPNLAAIS